MFRLALLLLIASFPLHAQTINRVVSLAPSATELADAAGLGDKLVAVSEYSDYPEYAKKLEKVANHQGINIERIITLQPDLIIAWPSGNPAKDLAKLRQFGFTFYDAQSTSLAEIAKNIDDLSQFADDPSIGQKSANDFRQALKELKQKYNTDEPVSYFYQLSEKPIITVANGNWPSEVFAFCGGVNVFEESSASYPQVGLEQVILANPEVIFTSRHATENAGMWQPWAEQLQALQKEQVWVLQSDWLNRPTPRTLHAIEQVCELFETVRQKR
ncbi:cobalamin-binding protein [Vibrio ponticus]|uniref:Vitamin B12-binding protein n=1 Tax=Vibrio ponticus TaxID=265668 RepID=A0ABX3FA35_9VIBR|nr:vitamin B12 ABC transporter substrate-binding protein BtuF [Vibrio ponticus]OLQ87522.1 cobalamin-binding protein [Vibrio ponticus]